MDSSTTSSPFSTRSTIPSSPEAINSHGGGESSTTFRKNGHAAFATGSGHLMHDMQAILSNFAGSTYPSFTPDFTLRQSPTSADIKTESKPMFPVQISSQPQSRPSTSAAPSITGSTQGGSRTEPPRRDHEVEGLTLVSPSLDDIAGTYPSRNKILLQGDPQVINKQRVETAIRVIIDILRLIPPSPANPPIHPTLVTALPRDGSGNVIASFERLANFRALRLQAGTTTKTSSKKQLQAGAIPPNQVAYVETAVYMSGENGKRVYACKRCRNREERRRQNKDAARKKHVNSESDSSASPAPRRSLQPATEDYVTGENPTQYDPHRVGQVVEEPPWDPTLPDWRHEIVLFNSPPEVGVNQGSCFWLPFRVICYCKCHGEKVGFRIKFTLRTFDGRIIASEMTNPIKITDDHKTDAKAKPRVDRLTSTSSMSQPRARKGRMSTASSQRQSPAPSESEMSVTSEVGAVVQKQTPQVRQGKPYERPPSQSPAVTTTNLPFNFSTPAERPINSRQPSVASYASQPDLTNWSADSAHQATVSPDALRRPNFTSMSAINGTGNNPLSSASSVAASPVQSFLNLSSNDIYGNDLSLSPHAGMDLSSLGGGMPLQSSSAPMLFGNNNRDDVDMANVATELENMLFGGSNASVSSSFRDDASNFSGFQQGSLFSDSGLAPDSMLDDMIDYSGGESQTGLSPLHQLNLSPSGGMGTIDLGMQTSPFMHNNGLPMNGFQSNVLHANSIQPNSLHANGMPNVGSSVNQDAQTRALLALIAQHQQQPVPFVSHVIPAEGDMAGGTPVAIAGRLFSPETVILFGGRPAITTYVTDSFLQCTLPASPVAGDVEVSVQGALKDLTAPAMMFKYTGMDKEMMRLMLEVRQRHQSSDPAVRLVDHLARSQPNSDLSDRSSVSPNGSSPMDSEASSDPKNVSPVSTDLQTTLITFLQTLDDSSPGSLRRSGVVNHCNKARQTLLHIATVMGFHRLLRRLVVVGAHLDLQDINGFTPLAFAALCGQTTCARVLLEAGASYDVPTTFGEMPLDLAKFLDHKDVENILLSAVWSTKADEEDLLSSMDAETTSEIDNDNPSSDSENDGDSVSQASRLVTTRKSKRSKGKHRATVDKPLSVSPRRGRRISPDATPQQMLETLSPPRDDPPPYAPSDSSSWMSRTLSNISHPLPDAVWGGLPSFFGSEKSSVAERSPASGAPQGWVAFPAPSWDTLQKMTSPEEVKLFTQAMAAAALNAVVQSGATTTVGMDDHRPQATISSISHRSHSPSRRRKSSNASSRDREVGGGHVVKQVKQDRMLYLFWLPILLFVGFWLLVTALPIATGFCLLYARQFSRAIKQRL